MGGMEPLRLDYRVSLLHLEDDFLRAGRTAESLIVPAASALREGDERMAHTVVARDDDIHAAVHAVVERVHDLIMRQAPVADELRLLLAVSHAARSVQRIGDHAYNISRLACGASTGGQDEDLRDQLHELALAAERAVRTGLDCFGRRDADGVARLDDVEGRVDLLSDGLIGRLMAHSAGGREAAAWAIRMVQAAKHMERIGDHAVGIAEQGAYVSTGALRPPRGMR